MGARFGATCTAREVADLVALVAEPSCTGRTLAGSMASWLLGRRISGVDACCWRRWAPAVVPPTWWVGRVFAGVATSCWVGSPAAGRCVGGRWPAVRCAGGRWPAGACIWGADVAARDRAGVACLGAVAVAMAVAVGACRFRGWDAVAVTARGGAIGGRAGLVAVTAPRSAPPHVSSKTTCCTGGGPATTTLSSTHASRATLIAAHSFRKLIG